MTIYFARISNMTCRVAEKQLIHLANRSVDNIYNCWQNLTGFQNQSASFMIKESVGTRERRGSSILPWKTTEEDDAEEANAKLSYSETLTPTSQWSLSHVASRKQSCFYMTSGNFSFFPPTLHLQASCTVSHSSACSLSLSPSASHRLAREKRVISNLSWEFARRCQQTKLSTEVWTLLHGVPAVSRGRKNPANVHIHHHPTALRWPGAPDPPRTLWVVFLARCPHFQAGTLRNTRRNANQI